MKKLILALLIAAGILFAAPAAAQPGSNYTLDQLCMNPAYAHHHRALCANATHPADYN